MVKERARLPALVILLAALPLEVQAQDAASRLDAVVQAMGAADLATIRYTGAGSGYTIEAGGESRQYFRIRTYTREIDFGAPAARTHAVRLAGGAEENENRTVRGNSSWPEQHELWITPHGFLKAALAASPSLERRSVQGTEYDVLTFTTPDGHEIEGYIDDDDRVARVRTAFDDPVQGETEIEASYLHYQDYGGVGFPTTIIHKRNGELVLVLIVSAVEPGASLNLAAE